jgi:maltose alpha-D-glucosyltransferase / alpha-amylase
MAGNHDGARPKGPIPVDPTWYKDAILYEVPVRAFSDSTADGSGDFVGLTGRLDYLRDLGITAIWLLPFYPSPLRDDGYDISDYTSVHPHYGTLSDFRTFLKAAHARGLRIIIELVLNHTSDQHPWFQRARRAPPDSAERSYYMWSDTPDKFLGARIIFKDFESSNWTWDPVAKAYFFHRFYSQQPDLNYDNPSVRRAIYRTIDFWLEMGVDGLRLDAVPYLFKREGTNCENLPETHEFLKELRAHIDARYPGRMLLAEANQWPEDAAAYFGGGRGDECHTAFHFPLMPRLFMAVRMGSRFPIVDMLAQTPAIPPDCQWLLFLRNHDELTLEMVSDEERDYMYRMYARDARMRVNLGIRRRLAPLLRNDRRVIELITGLLFALPGSPVLYYGDEIGMGDNIYLGDRNGVRTPMQWSPDRNAGFSQANPQRLYLPIIIDPEYHYETVNVESQQANPNSLLWHMKRLIALRRQTRSLGRGDITFLHPENPRILAFVRTYEGEQVLVVANVSHLAQSVDLNLAAYRGMRPTEMFGQTPFPIVPETPYRFSLGPYGFFWFRLETPATPGVAAPPVAAEPALLTERGDWTTLERPWVRERVEVLLQSYLSSQRWFRGKSLVQQSVRWIGQIAVAGDSTSARLVFLRVRFSDAEPQTYLIPLGFSSAVPAAALGQPRPSRTLVAFKPSATSQERLLSDVAQEVDFVRRIVQMMGRNYRRREQEAELSGHRTEAFETEILSTIATLPVLPVGGEQSNTSAKIGDHFVLKLFRTLDVGTNPEVELGQFFLRGHPAPVAPLAGHLELKNARGETFTLATLHRFVPNEGDAWGLTRDHLRSYFDRARAQFGTGTEPPRPGPFFDLETPEAPSAIRELIGEYLELATRIGRRTAEFHAQLASDTTDPAFAPEPFDARYVRSIFQSMQSQRQQVFSQLRDTCPLLPETQRRILEEVLRRESDVDARFRRLLERKFGGQRTRIHGDYHLAQVLWTGKDFVIIDIEGEPLRSISERGLKRSALRDVAGMLRSFDYAAQSALQEIPLVGGTAAPPGEELQPLANLWVNWCWWAFLRGYRAATTGAAFLPREVDEFRTLLGAYVLDRTLYESVYELTNRPAWLPVPLRGLLRLLNTGE